MLSEELLSSIFLLAQLPVHFSVFCPHVLKRFIILFEFLALELLDAHVRWRDRSVGCALGRHGKLNAVDLARHLLEHLLAVVGGFRLVYQRGEHLGLDHARHAGREGASHRVKQRLLFLLVSGVEQAHRYKFLGEPGVDLLQVDELQFVVLLDDHFVHQVLQLAVQLNVVLKLVARLSHVFGLLRGGADLPVLLGLHVESFEPVNEVFEKLVVRESGLLQNAHVDLE